MAAIAHATVATKGKLGDGDAAVKSLLGWKYNSPQGPIEIDPATRDIIMNEYLVEVVKGSDGKLHQKKIGKIEHVKDPCKELKIGPCAPKADLLPQRYCKPPPHPGGGFVFVGDSNVVDMWVQDSRKMLYNFRQLSRANRRGDAVKMAQVFAQVLAFDARQAGRVNSVVEFANMLLGGLAAGMVLFIVSVGLSVTMGLMGFVNLAHGGFAMIGGYVVVLAMNRLGVPFALALVISFVFTAAISVVFERFLYSRLYRAAELDQVLFTIGLIFMMIATVTLIVGPESQPLNLPDWMQGQFNLGFMAYRTYSLVLIVAGVVIMLGLWLGFERTRMGAQIRAAVDNRRMAESLGINIGLLFTLVFAFGSGMAALGGGLGAEFLGLDPQYPLKYLVMFLIVVAVGGLGRITGVFYAALIIGVLDFTLKKYFPQGGTVFIYAMTILLLLWRPQGLFGRAP